MSVGTCGTFGNDVGGFRIGLGFMVACGTCSNDVGRAT